MRTDTKTFTDTVLDVPYVSQYVDIQDADQRLFSCHIVNAYMALLYLGAKLPSLDDFVAEGIREGGFSDSGWKHDYLVEVFNLHGFSYGRAECMRDRSVHDIAAALRDNKPVLVSVVCSFWNQRLFHGVLLTGLRESADGELCGFFYHDPARRRKGEGTHLYVDLPTFYLDWRRMAILPSPFLLPPNTAG